MNLVPIWASSSPGDFVPHLDLVSGVFLKWAKLGPGDCVPQVASPGPSDSGPPLGLTRSWDTGPQLGTTGPGESTPHLGLIWTLYSFPTWHQWDMVTLFPLGLTWT